jgi:hypothetical protein
VDAVDCRAKEKEHAPFTMQSHYFLELLLARNAGDLLGMKTGLEVRFVNQI